MSVILTNFPPDVSEMHTSLHSTEFQLILHYELREKHLLQHISSYVIDIFILEIAGKLGRQLDYSHKMNSQQNSSVAILVGQMAWVSP